MRHYRIRSYRTKNGNWLRSPGTADSGRPAGAGSVAHTFILRIKRAYLFAYRTADAQPIVVFDYCGSRSGEHARRFLGEWRGALMVDDYAGYKASLCKRLVTTPSINLTT